MLRFRRRSQVARQRSAKPPSPVRFWASPPPSRSNWRRNQRRSRSMGLTPVKMPQLGESVTEGTVERWLKREGDFIQRDEPLVEVVTDKVNAEIPSPYQGRLVRINIAEGQTVPVGAQIAEMDVSDSVPPASPADTKKEPDTESFAVLSAIGEASPGPASEHGEPGTEQ